MKYFRRVLELAITDYKIDWTWPSVTLDSTWEKCYSCTFRIVLWDPSQSFSLLLLRFSFTLQAALHFNWLCFLHSAPAVPHFSWLALVDVYNPAIVNIHSSSPVPCRFLSVISCIPPGPFLSCCTSVFCRCFRSLYYSL